MENNDAKAIWKQYQSGLDYFERSGLKKEWEECENFYEGNHWPDKTPRTKNLPRPVINLCSMIADNKKSGILSEKIKLVYKPAELYGSNLEKSTIGANLFTKFSDNISQELHQQDLDEEAVENATQLGTYIYHYYWDKEITGGMETPYIGGERGEILHPKNVIVSNPRQKNVQKQSYIIIASVEPLKAVKAFAKNNGIKNLEDINPDHEIIDEATKNLEVCTVLTKYSRVNNKVVWSKSTKNVMLQNMTYWEPSMNLNKVQLTAEEEEITEPDNPSKDLDLRKQLYPIVIKSHKSRRNSIYGIGEVAQVIPNNKSINFSLALMLLSVQQTAWPKIIQKAGALARQAITNKPGEVLTDNTKGANWGFKYMETSGFSPQALTLTDSIMSMTRTFTGSSEVVTGEVLGANMAASAIIALQNQAKKPIEIYKNKFYRAHIEIGKIHEQFFKYYYNDGRTFGYEENNRIIINKMNGEEYKDIEFNTTIDVGASGMFSESLSISLLDSLLNLSAIDIDEYIELYPSSVMPFKEQLKKMRQEKLKNTTIDNETTQYQNQPITNGSVDLEKEPLTVNGLTIPE